MKKIILSLILALFLAGCASTNVSDYAEPDIYEKRGVIESVTDSAVIINGDDGYFEIENTDSFADKTSVGRSITIKYEDDKITDISVYNLPYEEEAENILENMTLEEKVGQMFFVRFDGENPESPITDYNIGGYILFARDFENETHASITDKLAYLQSLSKLPLLIAVDEEGGTVNRVSKFSQFAAEPFKSPSELYNDGGYENIYDDALAKSQLLKSLGINVNLAPVCDISLSEDDYIHERSIGFDADGTSEYVKTVVTAMDLSKIGSALKHFPGYGNNVDTHTGIAVDERSYETIIENDLKPFIAGIEAGADSILVSHNIVTAIDENYPASLSKPAHDIIRNNLEFEGVVMTDDLDMEAVREYTENTAVSVLAIEAGNDMILCSDYDVQIESVIKAVKDGVLSEERIDESVSRILRWKLKLGVL